MANEVQRPMDLAFGELHRTEIALQMLREEADFDCSDREQVELAQERIIVLMQSIETNVAAARAKLDCMRKSRSESGHE